MASSASWPATLAVLNEAVNDRNCVHLSQTDKGIDVPRVKSNASRNRRRASSELGGVSCL